MSNLIERFKAAFDNVAKARGQAARIRDPRSSLAPERLAELRSALADSYALEQEVGTGGMAIVFRARDLKHDREVALKVLRPGLGSQAARERFLREIRLAARLTHPHILPLHDSGEAAGLLFYVMPYVAGPTLKDRMRQEGRLPVDEAVDIVRAVAVALDYAHRQGVVHRDIKPANIMMNEGVAVVTDFGIGKALSAAGLDQTASDLTQEGMLIGTPAYMSPEQTAKGGEVDGRSDIYSLGLVLHELLTGEPLFSGPTPIALLVKRASEPRPELRYPPDVPDELRTVVRSALGDSPDERFNSGAEFVTALVGAQRVGPETATPPDTPAVPRAGASIAVLPFRNMSGDPDNEYFSDGITEEIINSLTRLSGLRVAARTSSFVFKGENVDVKQAGQRLGVTSVLEGSVRQAGNRLRITAQLINVADGYHLWSERWDRELDDVFAVQDEIAAAIAERLEVSLPTVAPEPAKPPTGDVEAYRLYLKGRHAWNRRSEAGLREAVGLFEQAIARDPEFAAAYSGIADAYLLLGSYQMVEVEEANAKAKAAALEALRLDETLAEAHASMGQVRRRERDWEGEEREYLRAIELNPNYATAHQWYSTYLAALGRMDEAVHEVRKAEQLDPLSHAILVTSAIVCDLARDVDGALRRLKKALELEPDFTSAVAYSGYVYAQRGLFEEALATNDWMVERFGEGHGRITAHRAAIYALGGDHGRATALLDKAIAEGDADPAQIGFIYAALGEPDLAFEWLARAVDENSNVAFYLKVYPAADVLRSDPRFDRLLERMGVA